MKNKKREIYEELKKNPKNVKFTDICKAAELFGFKYRGGRGSHVVYVREGVKEILNFQNVKGKVKPYQVKQFLKIIEKYKLLEEDE
jgi:predicted RNA binding protein YcfA (HicA-like mRNA interferase family)